MRIRPAEADGSVVLRLEGSLSGQWVDELRRVTWEPVREPSARLVLDLAEVTFIDADGLALLRELSLRHVVLRNGSLFVTQQLKASEEKPWGA
jgi:anti-anti-sigma factor